MGYRRFETKQLYFNKCSQTNTYYTTTLQKNILARKTRDYIKEIDNPNEAYSKFLYNFSSLYEEAFPKLEIKIKQKNLISPWITKLNEIFQTKTTLKQIS